jgi:hypothetical protein
MVRKLKKNLAALWLCVFSAVFLFLSGRTGANELISLERIVASFVHSPYLDLFFFLLLVFASLGGLTVLIGGILILNNRLFWGNVMVSLGSGAGIISFLFNLFISFIVLNEPIYSLLSYSSLGVIFAIAAQMVSEKKKK